MNTHFNLNKVKVGKRFFYIVEDQDRNLFDNIKIEIQNKYHLKMPNRDAIIKNIINNLTHGDYKNSTVPNIDLIIFRTDIKNFYPSINKHKLYRKVNSANILSYKALYILKKLIFNKKIQGVPLGLPFSNHLSELFMEKFDNELSVKLNPIIYYRYIDDIIIIKYSDAKDDTERKKEEKYYFSEVSGISEKLNLNLNSLKTETSFYRYNKKELDKNSDLKFSYLGYEFETKENKLVISVSPVKLKKYKSRISKYIYDYKNSKKRDLDYWRLYYKLINELYGITTVHKSGKKMKSGLGHHYRFVNNYSNLNDFIIHFNNIIYSLKLNTTKRDRLLNLFKDKSGLIFMQRRFNYLNLTDNQMILISRRLCINTSVNSKEKFLKSVFKSLYKN